MIKDMTSGKPVSLILGFSIPMLAGNIFQQLYNMADSIIVGNFVGPDALAAIGACSALSYLFFSLCFGLSAGIGVIISQYFGCGSRKNVARAMVNGAYIIAAAAVMLTVPGVFLADFILGLLSTPDAIISQAALYFRITSVGMTAVAFYNGISAIMRALGDSRTPLLFLMCASILNIVLDLVFVICFHQGVAGTAAATILSQAMAAAASVFYAFRKNPYFKFEKEDLRPDRELLEKILRIGIPMGLQNAMIAFSCVLLQRVINSFGTLVMAVFTVTNRIESFVQQPYITISTALSTYTGQNIGAGKMERVKEGVRGCSAIIILFSLAMLAAMHLFGRPIVGIFGDQEEIIALGGKALGVISWFYVAWGMLYVFRSVLNGAGDAFFAFFSGVLEVAVRVCAAVFLTGIPMIGMWGIWMSEGITWIFVSITGCIRYYKGKWKQNKII